MRIYSVKSGYNFLAKENSINNRVQGNQMQHQGVWKDIWGLTVSNKVRNVKWNLIIYADAEF